MVKRNLSSMPIVDLHSKHRQSDIVLNQ